LTSVTFFDHRSFSEGGSGRGSEGWLCPPNRSEGGCPGATTITNLSWEQEQSKKCDKQLTHIVRVIVSALFICQVAGLLLF